MHIQKIEIVIKKLSIINELVNLATWLIDYHDQIWDQQIEEDLDSGKLDQLDEINSEYEARLVLV